MSKPKILIYDIETAPILGYVWGLWENNLGLNQIAKDWHILSWAAKWLDNPNVMYMDQRNAKHIEDDSKILKGIWKLLDEADIVITQNGRSFDEKKLNARFILNGLQPPSTSKHIDTKVIAKKKFAFTSNKLEYMTDKLNNKYKKLKHPEFEGFTLWRECLAGNKRAWAEMEKYNKHDVLSTEELYKKFVPWDDSINFQVFNPDGKMTCNCGSTCFIKYGLSYTNTGKFQRYRCENCGKSMKDRRNLFTPDQRKNLKGRA